MTRPILPANHVSEEMASWTISGKVRVSIGWIGEGFSGEYDEQDPTDIPFLRFNTYDLAHPEGTDGYRSSQDASYCTALPAWVSLSDCSIVCRAIAEEIQDETSWKRHLEAWSWVDEFDVTRMREEGR